MGNSDNKMKQTLVIGSTVVDVMLSVPSLPRRGEDVNLTASDFRIGGCAYNVYKTMRLFESPALLCSPVGQGVYGHMVRNQLKSEGISPFVDLAGENGCCYCLIEPDGERSFLSHHGAEYLFSRSWMKNVDFSNVGEVFICGLEVEEPTGSEIVDFVHEHPELDIYFSPGPRIMHIGSDKMERLLNHRGKTGKGLFLHLNETEALRFSGKHKLAEAADFLTGKTGNAVVITLGERGCFCLENNWLEGRFVPGYPATVVNTVGAGDAHCGALIACLKNKMALEEACKRANRIGAALVETSGSVLEKLPD